MHELLTIDKHTLQPYVQAIGSELEQASHEALAVDTATVRCIRQLPASQNTKVGLGDLALSEMELRNVDTIVRQRGTAYSQLPSRLMVAFVVANRGCYRVKVVKPLSG